MIRKKLKGLVVKVKKYPVRTAVALALVGLSALTSLKDNVHFGSVNLNNPRENHYAWGIWPTIRVNGEAQGNMGSYGLFIGDNSLGDNSTITGNMESYGLFGGHTELGDNSTITGNMGSYGLLIGCNRLGDNSTITGNMGSYGLFGGCNRLGDNSKFIRGDISSRGIIAISPKGGDFLTNVEIGLENYVHKTNEKESQ